jgi:hypothetical protein
MQPLATCMHYLKVSKMAVVLQISEPWFREYEVGTLIELIYMDCLHMYHLH